MSAQRIRKLMKHCNTWGLGEFSREGKNESGAREEQSKTFWKGCVWLQEFMASLLISMDPLRRHSPCQTWMICQLSTKPFFFKRLNSSYIPIVFPQNAVSLFQIAELNASPKASLSLMLAVINMAGWGYIPSRALTVLNISPYMPLIQKQICYLVMSLSIQPFRWKPFSCCRSSVRCSFSVNSTAGWFPASVPSDLEAKAAGATGCSYGTKSGWGLWYSTWLLLCYTLS